MSVPEHEQENAPEIRSRVKLGRNAKGDPVWELSVRVGDTEAEVQEALRIAVAAHQHLLNTLIHGRAA